MTELLNLTLQKGLYKHNTAASTVAVTNPRDVNKRDGSLTPSLAKRDN